MTDSSPLAYLQQALDIAPKSPHPTNKVAATLFGTDENGEEWSVFRTNHWPDSIYETIGIDKKIGNASGTIHAETACIVNASSHPTEGASICITDPFCPNCAKNIAEAGIKTIYIDQSGFDKDFFKRRGQHFDTMSMQICERAGISVYAIDMFNEKISSILEITNDYTPTEDSPIYKEPIESANDAVFSNIVEEASQLNKRRKFSVAFVTDQNGKKFALTARAHAVIGYSMQEPDEALNLLTPIGKYSFIQEPVNRMIMHIARKGYTLINGYLYCSQVPTAREQVNLVGANINRIAIGDLQRCRDTGGFEAMKMLRQNDILSFD